MDGTKKPEDYQGDASSRVELKESDGLDKNVGKTPDIDAINHSMRENHPDIFGTNV